MLQKFWGAWGSYCEILRSVRRFNEKVVKTRRIYHKSYKLIVCVKIDVVLIRKNIYWKVKAPPAIDEVSGRSTSSKHLYLCTSSTRRDEETGRIVSVTTWESNAVPSLILHQRFCLVSPAAQTGQLCAYTDTQLVLCTWATGRGIYCRKTWKF